MKSMDFIRRRLMMAAGGGAKYVWAVYDFAYVRDDENATTGSVTLSQTLMKMAASAYTVNEGGFTLTGAVTTQVQNLQIGQFIVNIATNTGADVTSGQYLYEVTGKSGSWTRTIQYKRYGVKAGKGDTELYRVESDTPDYPIDGEQDGLWYVMLKGEYEAHVWDVFNDDTSYTLVGTNFPRVSTTSSTWYYIERGDNTIDFNSTTGYFVFNNPKTVSVANMQSLQDSSSRSFFYSLTNANVREVYRTYRSHTLSGSTYSISFSAKEAIEVQASKGSATGETVSSRDIDAYPQDGVQGDYWYTYKGTQIVEFDNT